MKEQECRNDTASAIVCALFGAVAAMWMALYLFDRPAHIKHFGLKTDGDMVCVMANMSVKESRYVHCYRSPEKAAALMRKLNAELTAARSGKP